MSELKKSDAQLAKPRERKSVIYTILLPLVRGLFRTLLPVQYHGLDNVGDMEAPFIMMDPVLLAAALPREQIRFVGKKELWRSKPFAWFARELKAIPVDRHNTDMEAMRSCMRVVREGHVLGIFPEGTRYHEGLMTELESGVAVIALRAKVPLVPVYISGKLRLFRKLHVYVGKPIRMDDLREIGINTESCGLLLGRITEAYAALDAARPET